MSPIFVRPVREQAEHDRLIRFLQPRYKRKFETVLVNVGDEQVAPVKLGANTFFPDVVMSIGKKLMGVAEIETGESVNNLEAMAQWVPYARAKVPLTLYIPIHQYDVARRLCDANGVAPTEIWTYRPSMDGFDLIRMFHDPSLDREPPKAAKPEKKPEKKPAAKPALKPKAAKPAAKKPAKPAAKAGKSAKTKNGKKKR